MSNQLNPRIGSHSQNRANPGVPKASASHFFASEHERAIESINGRFENMMNGNMEGSKSQNLNRAASTERTAFNSQENKQKVCVFYDLEPDSQLEAGLEKFGDSSPAIAATPVTTFSAISMIDRGTSNVIRPDLHPTSSCGQGVNEKETDDRLLDFEQPLENQVIYIDPIKGEPTHLHLLCRLTHPERRAHITWSYNDSPKLPLAQFNTSFDGRTARLIAKGLKPEYSGSYACEIRLPCGSSTAYTQCEVTIHLKKLYGAPSPSPASTFTVPPYPDSQSHDLVSPVRRSHCEYEPSNLTSARPVNHVAGVNESTTAPNEPPPPPPPLPTPSNNLPTPPPPHTSQQHYMRKPMGVYVDTENMGENFTSPPENYTLRMGAQRVHMGGRGHSRYPTVSARSECVNLPPGEYIELRTPSDFQASLEDDEQMDEMDLHYENLRRSHIQSRGRSRTWRNHGTAALPMASIHEPRVILINTGPATAAPVQQHGDMACKTCCCTCHRSRCMYKGAEGYPVVNETIYTSRGAVTINPVNRRSNRRISFNPETETCGEDAVESAKPRPVSAHVPETSNHDPEEALNQMAKQATAASCSRITQHATVKPEPNKRPDASWSSGPDKYLPKASEIQTPEAFAAARAAIKKILESRMTESTVDKKPKPVKPGIKPPKAKPEPLKNVPPPANEPPLAEKMVEPKTDSPPQPIPPKECPVAPDSNKKAAKERFKNALARFQVHESDRPERESFKQPNSQAGHREVDAPLQYSEDNLVSDRRADEPPPQTWRRRSFGNTKTFLQTATVSINLEENVPSKQEELENATTRPILEAETLPDSWRDKNPTSTAVTYTKTMPHQINENASRSGPFWRTKSVGNINASSDHLNPTKLRREPISGRYQPSNWGNSQARQHERRSCQGDNDGTCDTNTAECDESLSMEHEVSYYQTKKTSIVGLKGSPSPVTAYSERFTSRHSNGSDNHSKWQQQRSKIFRTVSQARSPGTSKPFNRREDRDCSGAICYPEEDTNGRQQQQSLRKVSSPSMNEIQPSVNANHASNESTDPVAFLNEHFRKYTDRPLTLLEMKNLVLSFVQLNTSEYLKYGVEVTNFSTSWTDGVAMCALMHHFFPQAFDFNAALAGGKVENFRLAFEVAAELAEVPNFIAPEEVTRNEVGPDWRRIFLYLSYILVALSDHPLNKATPSLLFRSHR